MIKKSTFLIKETNYTKSGKYRNNRIWNSINNAEKSLKHSLRIMKKQDDYIHINKNLTAENLYYSEIEFTDNTDLFNKIRENIKRDIFSFENKELFDKQNEIKKMVENKKELYNQLREIYNIKGKEFQNLKKLNLEISDKFDNLKEAFSNKPLYLHRIYYNRYRTPLPFQMLIETINLLIEINNTIQKIQKSNKIDNIKKDIEKYKNMKNEIKSNIDKLNSEYKITKNTIKSTNDNIKTDINKKKLYKDFSNTKQALKRKNILELVEKEVNNGNLDNKSILHNIRYKHKVTTVKAKDKRTLKTIQKYLDLLPKVKEKKEKRTYNNQALTKEILFKIPEHQLLNIDKKDFLEIVKKFKDTYFKDYKLLLSAVHLDEGTEKKPHIHLFLSGLNQKTLEMDINKHIFNLINEKYNLNLDKNKRSDHRIFMDYFQKDFYKFFNRELEKLNINCRIGHKIYKNEKSWKKRLEIRKSDYLTIVEKHQIKPDKEFNFEKKDKRELIILFNNIKKSYNSIFTKNYKFNEKEFYLIKKIYPFINQKIDLKDRKFVNDILKTIKQAINNKNNFIENDTDIAENPDIIIENLDKEIYEKDKEKEELKEKIDNLYSKNVNIEYENEKLKEDIQKYKEIAEQYKEAERIRKEKKYRKDIECDNNIGMKMK